MDREAQNIEADQARALFAGLINADARDIAERLVAERVYVSRRGDNIRVSPHLFNDMADIERLFAALDKVLSG